MNLLAMLGWPELVILVLLTGIGIACWLVFSRSANEKKDE